MAKKSIATLQTGKNKVHTKVIKMVKSPKNGAYQFKEKIIAEDAVKNFFNEK